MQLERLTCSSCRGALEWNAENKVFVCTSCGSVFRRLDQVELDKNEKELERARLEYELQRAKRKVELEQIKAEAQNKKERRDSFNETVGWIVSAVLLILVFIMYTRYLNH